MSRKKRMQDVREAKDRRAKKLAIGGAVVLVAVLAYQMSHMLGGKKSAAAPAATTTTPVAGAPSTTTPPGTAGAAILPTTGTTTGSTKLTNSDPAPQRSKSELYAFNNFSGKDPFVQQLAANTGSTGGTSGTSGTTSTPSGQTASSVSPSSSPNTTVTASVRKAPARKSSSARSLAQTGVATISINGKSETVRIGAGFPSANPLFRLVSVSHGVARIGIANGSYSSGAHTVSLAVGRTLTLVDTADGIRYKLQLRTAG
jgi:hypothetical protein